MGDTGPEHLARIPGKTSDSKAGGAESGAVTDEIGPIDPNLQQIIKAWPRLTRQAKVGILAMVKAADQPHPNRSQADDDIPTDTDRR